MAPLTSIDQLKLGVKLRIIAKSESDCYGSVSVKEIVEMRRFDKLSQKWSGVYDYEILINKSKNYYFSFRNYLAKESVWIKEVYVLRGVDKRLKTKVHN